MNDSKENEQTYTPEELVKLLEAQVLEDEKNPTFEPEVEEIKEVKSLDDDDESQAQEIIESLQRLVDLGNDIEIRAFIDMHCRDDIADLVRDYHKRFDGTPDDTPYKQTIIVLLYKIGIDVLDSHENVNER